MSTPYDALMDEVCVRLGFCGCVKNGKPLHVDHFIPSHGPVTAQKFAEWVFLADDMNPSSRPERWERVRASIEDAFIRHMGTDVVDASELQWSFADAAPPKRRHLRQPLLLKHEVWRPFKNGQLIRYNCVQNVRTGEVCVLTADVGVPEADERAQMRYFIDRVLDCDPVATDSAIEWFRSLEDAIAAHDEAFGNDPS